MEALKQLAELRKADVAGQKMRTMVLIEGD